MRLPDELLALALNTEPARLAEAGIKSVTAVGDCLAPATIAAAVYAGHRYARELDTPPLGDAVAFKREMVLDR
jgi:dimethylamine/trimethylamine dehydrogenase